MKKINNILNLWNHLVLNHSVAILVALPVIALLLIVYISQNLTMNTDTRDMLSETLDWRQLDIQYESLFPHAVDTLIVVIEAQTPDEASDAGIRLMEKLKQEPELFKTVFHFNSETFIRDSSLLYLELDELYELADKLALYQPFLGQLLNDQSLNGFISLLTQAIKHQDQGQNIDISPVITEFLHTIIASNNNDHYQISWQGLIANSGPEKTIYQDFIILQPVLDYSDLFPAETILQTIKDYAVESGITADKHRAIKLTGPVALAHEEFKSVSEANLIAIIVALLLVSILLIIGLGSFKLVLVVLSALIIGLIYTAAFATAAIGELNLISIAFAVLYIGLGVDFAIHYCLKYREQIMYGSSVAIALETTIIDIGKTLVICAITTAIGFFAFLVTDYQGVAELGLIAGSGMFISLFMTITFIPAVLKTFSITTSKRQFTNKHLLYLTTLPERSAKTILTISILFIILSCILIPNIRFDYDLLNIQPPENESVITFRQLLTDEELSVMTNVVVTDDRKTAIKLKDELTSLTSVKDVVWMEDFIPAKQDEKLIVIDDMNLLLGDVLSSNSKKEYPLETTIKSIQTLKEALLSSDIQTLAVYQSLIIQLEQFLQRLQGLEESGQKQVLMDMENSVFASLAGRISSLKQGLETEGLVLEDISSTFKHRWLTDSHYLLEVIPSKNLSDIENLKQFVNETQSAVATITGPPVVTIEAGNAVIDAFKLAFCSAFAAVTVLLFVLMRNKRDVVYVLIPLLTAALYTGATCVVIGLPLNFANIIALPLLFGIGVDSAIHIIEQNNRKSSTESLLESSTARAILISALTTVLSIGNLALSPHLGTASMGKLLVIGISYALLCTLLITPALINRR